MTEYCKIVLDKRCCVCYDRRHGAVLAHQVVAARCVLAKPMIRGNGRNTTFPVLPLHTMK